MVELCDTSTAQCCGKARSRHVATIEIADKTIAVLNNCFRSLRA
jgi:hypothetical protein